MPSPSADPLSAARAVMPLWVIGMPLVWPVVGALVSRVSMSALAAYASRALAPIEGEHWTERARRTWPTRIWAGLAITPSVLLVPLGAVATGVLSPVAPWAIAILTTIGVVLGASRPWARYQQSLFGRRRSGSWRGAVALFAILLGSIAIALLTLVALPDAPGLTGNLLLAAGALALIGYQVGGAFPLLHGVGLVRSASPRSIEIAQRASAASGIKPRRIYEIDTAQANAFAVPTTKTLIYTTGLLAALDDAEIEAITQHELGHLSESGAMIAMRLLGALSMTLPILAYRRLAAAAWYLPLVVLSIQLVVAVALARWRNALERRADDAAHAHESALGVYARALERLHEFNLVPAVMPGKRRVHPHLYDRMVASGVTPSWPRPEPPKMPRRRMLLAFVLFVVPMAAIEISVLVFAEGRPQLRLAFGGGEPSLVDLALEEGTPFDESIVLLREAEHLDPWDGCLVLDKARIEARAGRCAEAREDLRDSRDSCRAWGPRRRGRFETAVNQACPPLPSPDD